MNRSVGFRQSQKVLDVALLVGKILVFKKSHHGGKICFKNRDLLLLKFSNCMRNNTWTQWSEYLPAAFYHRGPASGGCTEKTRRTQSFCCVCFAPETSEH